MLDINILKSSLLIPHTKLFEEILELTGFVVLNTSAERQEVSLLLVKSIVAFVSKAPDMSINALQLMLPGRETTDCLSDVTDKNLSVLFWVSLRKTSSLEFWKYY